MIIKQIPISFINKHCQISWQDASWGYVHQLLGWKDIVDLAKSLVASGSNDEMVMELSSLSKDKVWLVGDLLKKLAASERPERDESIRRKWLYLVLVWLFEKRIDIEDPLGEVEAVYADFDYPSEIQGFVRYMPVSGNYDPTKHALIDNEHRLFSLWQEYLDRTRRELGCA